MNSSVCNLVLNMLFLYLKNDTNTDLVIREIFPPKKNDSAKRLDSHQLFTELFKCFVCVCVSIIEYYKCIIGQTPQTTTGWSYFSIKYALLISINLTGTRNIDVHGICS